MQPPLETLTLTGFRGFQGSLLVPRPMAQSTPHAWAPYDLGFPLLITGVFSGTHLS